jgi:4-amino-4-deoxy-L-arabinose transferase-like glycosyltransferase
VSWVVGVNQPSRARTDALLLAGFCAFLFFFGLSYFGLIGADEPRYAQVAREMLAHHDWVTPTLSGTPWLEKPPLYYWQAMIAYIVFGVSDWAARLPSAADATLMVIAIYFFLRRIRPGCELDGALMTASAAGVIGFARAASTDMPLTATFTITLLAWFAWHETDAKKYLALFYGCLALGTLAKGPVAILLAVLIIVLFAIAKSDYRLLWRTLWAPGVAIFCVVSLPWFIAVQLRNPEFFRVFFLQHNLERFATDLYHHRQPFWYYLPVLLLGLVPWTVFVIAALTEGFRSWWSERSQVFQSEDAFTGFLIIWLIVPAIFFSLSQSKLPGYIVPALPAGTLLLAEYVRRHVADDGRPGVVLSCLHSMVAALPLVPALMIQYIVLQHRLPWGKATVISFAFAGVLAVGVFATLRTRLGLGVLRFVTLIPVVLTVAAALRLGGPALDSTLSARPLAGEIGSLEVKRLPLAVFHIARETEYGLAFYRDQTIARYDRGEIPADEHLVLAPEGSQAAVAGRVVGRRVSYLGSFAPQGLDYYWVAKSSR